VPSRIGLYGGSFDPIHCGHILPILEARRQLELDRVVYLPTARPPHKPNRSMAPAHARFAMVELALLEYSGLVVSAFELTPDKPAYTLTTARYFATLDPEAELFLLIGGDSFREIESWYRWRELVEVCRLGILARPGWEPDVVSADLPANLEDLLARGTAIFVDNELVDVSSTRLRRLLGSGEAIAATEMPPLVVQYVRKYSLYS
jgi:nicotinate-nucleotide adenylyltransferase